MRRDLRILLADSLLGFSGVSPIAGDASLAVDLSTVADSDNSQDLQFSGIGFRNRFDREDRWLSTGDIDYKVRMFDNPFVDVTGEGHEQGVVIGAFLGSGHEHMGGTVKRTDMIGAFGGSR